MLVSSPKAARRRHEQGFTVLELMIASSVFAVIMLVVAVGVMRFGEAYFKGINSSNTQSTARLIMGDLTQSIQFSKSVTPIGPDASGLGGVCIDNTLYTYHLGIQITDSGPVAAKHQAYHGLVATTGVDCSAATVSTLTDPATQPATLVSGRELLGQHMRLGDLTVTPSGASFVVHLKVIYGDDDVLYPAISGSTVWNNELCSGSAGTQFCATSDLTTTVEKRLL